MQTAVFVLAVWLFAAIGNAQTTREAMTPTTPQTEQKTSETKSATVSQPVFTGYKQIKIGMTADEVRDKLGKAKIDDKDGFYYEISDDESAQIRLDKDKKVYLVSITYSHKNENAPKYADVFGADAADAAKPDGSIYNLVNYPQAGFWVAYSRTADDKPTVSVTMQKL